MISTKATQRFCAHVRTLLTLSVATVMSVCGTQAATAHSAAPHTISGHAQTGMNPPARTPVAESRLFLGHEPFFPQRDTQAPRSLIDDIETRVSFTDSGRARISSQEWHTLAPGVRMAHVVRRNSEGKNTILATFVDLDRAQVRHLEAEGLAHQRPTLETLAKAEQNDLTERGAGEVLVDAVNSSFFDRGETELPLGIVIDEGRLTKTDDVPTPAAGSATPHTHLVITHEGRADIRPIAPVEGHATVGGQNLEVDGLNTIRTFEDQLVAYDNRWGAVPLTGSVVEDDPQVFHALVGADSHVISAGEGLPRTPLAEGHTLLLARGRAREALSHAARPAARVDLSFDTGNLRYAVAADVYTPLFTAPRTPITQESDLPADAGAQGFIFSRHPRTAAGISQDGRLLVLVTVDGRGAGGSIGMGLPELGRLLVDVGAWKGVNLDGGGSTTHVARFPRTHDVTVANWPSDLLLRPLPSGLAVVVTPQDRRPVHFIARTPVSSVPVGTSTPLDVDAFNADGLPTEGKAQRWSSTDPRVATVDSEGRLLAHSEGRVQLRAYPSDTRDSVSVSVEPPIVAVSADPTCVRIARTGGVGNFVLWGIRADGTRAKLIPGQFDLPRSGAGIDIKSNANRVEVRGRASAEMIPWDPTVTMRLRSAQPLTVSVPVDREPWVKYSPAHCGS